MKNFESLATFMSKKIQKQMFSGINIGAENKENTATCAACKILSREHHGRVHLS
jgi:hypothetical protein